jgi:SAM-dependent methyltransferase
MFSGTVDRTRPKRMEAILEALKDHFRGPFTVLDLGTGPGPLTARMLRGFPKCRVVAVDTDPVLLRVGEEALHRFERRVTWHLADLRDPRWSFLLPVHRFDAAVSSLVLHWLEEDEIRAIYREVHRLLRPGGLIVNADFLPTLRTRNRRSGGRRLGETPREARRRAAAIRGFKSKWEMWWAALTREPSMCAAFDERQVRLPGTIPPVRTTGPKKPLSLESHERALRDAGFREIVVTWEDKDFRALSGLR